MNQLMIKINKHILRRKLNLSMPKIGDSFRLDSMDLNNEDVPIVIVNSVISWQISDDKHHIIRKALVQ